MVETKLSNNSSNKDLFYYIKKDHNDVLKINGYNYETNYTEEEKNIANLLKQTQVEIF